MNVFITLFFWVSIIRAQSKDFYTVYERTLLSLQPPNDQLESYVALAKQYSDSLQNNGTWPDIDYSNGNPAVWPSILHLNPRLLTMTTVFVTPDQPLFNSSALYQKIELALNFWLTKNPINSNWWYNDIGAPIPLAQIMIQLNHTTSPSQRKTAISYMDRAYTNGVTGANFVWMAYVYILKGLITGNETLLKTYISASFDQVTVAPGLNEGIKADGSFFQHGMQIYNGGYGEDFISIVLLLTYITDNTSYAIPEDQLGIWAMFVLGGTQWMSNFGFWDYSVRGRELTRPISYDLDFSSDYVAATAGGNNRDWVEFADRIRNGSYSPLIGNTHFWVADYMVHHREHFSASVKMYSTRTYNAECVNSEGANSLHLSDGVLNIYQSGKEYVGVFPLWDWERVPGITCALGEVASQCATVKNLGKTNFVGGVSNIMYGAAAFDFKAALTGTLSARKSWFFFDNEIVALGANITSESNYPIKTSLNQCILRSDVYVSSSPAPLPVANQTFENINWILHDDVAYIFPSSAGSVGVSNLVLHGSWNNIGQFTGNVSSGVFSAWINHPTNKGGSYEYVIVPGVELDEIQKDWKEIIPDLVILENSPALQAVLNTKAQVLQAIFWTEGILNGGENFNISVSAPCALLIQINNSSQTVNASLSDPSQLLSGSIKVSVSMNLKGKECFYNNDGTSTLLFELPTGENLGLSNTILCDLN